MATYLGVWRGGPGYCDPENSSFLFFLEREREIFSFNSGSAVCVTTRNMGSDVALTGINGRKCLPSLPEFELRL
jgi:hypothetical protein